MDRDTMGKRLRERRENAGFSQIEVAQQTGIIQRDLSLLERARSTTSLDAPMTPRHHVHPRRGRGLARRRRWARGRPHDANTIDGKKDFSVCVEHP